MKKLLLILLLNIAYFVNTAQNIIINGSILDANTKKPIENVYIKIQQQNIISKSDENGLFSIKLSKKDKVSLSFSHISYQNHYQAININKDSIFVKIELTRKIEQLPEANISANPKPIPVFKSAKINIADYEFYNDKFLFLVYPNRLSKDASLYLVDENENILAKQFIPEEPVELYTDYLGNINLICKNSIFRIEVNGKRIDLYNIPLNDFNQLIKPIVDTLGKDILFSDFLRQFPRFKYYAFLPSDTNVSVIKEIVHKDMAWQYNFEYYSMTNAEKQFAKRMAKRLKGYDKFDVAASMTGFANDFMYDPIYAPLFVINDTINIFDHYQNRIWKFINDTILVDSIPINYHHPKKQNEWKKQIIMDEVNGNVYGVFLKNGHYILKHININTGKVDLEKSLYYQYVSKIKIKDNYVYYTYKPSQTLQKKFLYKEYIKP